jgi:uracil phosphoribosyltransferase
MLTLVDHPILLRDLTVLRDRETPHGRFREKLGDVAAILAYEALRTMPVEAVRVETPLEPAEGHVLAREIVVVPVLRAGLGLVDGFVRFVPEARVGHLGMYRDEHTRRPVDYYSSIPPAVRDARVFVVDPMLATGGSAATRHTNTSSRAPRLLRWLRAAAALPPVASMGSTTNTRASRTAGGMLE